MAIVRQPGMSVEEWKKMQPLLNKKPDFLSEVAASSLLTPTSNPTWSMKGKKPILTSTGTGYTLNKISPVPFGGSEIPQHSGVKKIGTPAPVSTPTPTPTPAPTPAPTPSPILPTTPVEENGPLHSPMVDYKPPVSTNPPVYTKATAPEGVPKPENIGDNVKYTVNQDGTITIPEQSNEDFDIPESTLHPITDEQGNPTGEYTSLPESKPTSEELADLDYKEKLETADLGDLTKSGLDIAQDYGLTIDPTGKVADTIDKTANKALDGVTGLPFGITSTLVNPTIIPDKELPWKDEDGFNTGGGGLIGLGGNLSLKNLEDKYYKDTGGLYHDSTVGADKEKSKDYSIALEDGKYIYDGKKYETFAEAEAAQKHDQDNTTFYAPGDIPGVNTPISIHEGLIPGTKVVSGNTDLLPAAVDANNDGIKSATEIEDYVEKINAPEEFSEPGGDYNIQGGNKGNYKYDGVTYENYADAKAASIKANADPNTPTSLGNDIWVYGGQEYSSRGAAEDAEILAEKTADTHKLSDGTWTYGGEKYDSKAKALDAEKLAETPDGERVRLSDGTHLYNGQIYNNFSDAYYAEKIDKLDPNELAYVNGKYYYQGKIYDDFSDAYAAEKKVKKESGVEEWREHWGGDGWEYDPISDQYRKDGKVYSYDDYFDIKYSHLASTPRSDSSDDPYEHSRLAANREYARAKDAGEVPNDPYSGQQGPGGWAGLAMGGEVKPLLNRRRK